MNNSKDLEALLAKLSWYPVDPMTNPHWDETIEKAINLIRELQLDSERLTYIEKHARCDPKMDGQHVWWPTTFNKALVGVSIREAIDNAMKKE